MRNPRKNDGFTRQVTTFVIVLIGGLTLTLAHGPRGSAAPTPHETLSSMVHVRGGLTTLGIDATEMERFKNIFSVTMAQLFEEVVPKHKVNIRPFYIDKYLVTNSQFKRFVDGHPEWQAGKMPRQLDNGNYLKHWAGSFPAEKGNHPVVNVNWYAAMAYCRSQGERLPSEAEWEYAARGGLHSPVFPWGDEPANARLANYSASGLHRTSSVGSYPPNGYGIYDMAGNVWEFLADEWGKYPSNERSVGETEGASKDLQFLKARTRRVIRGGSFDGDPINLWVEYRDSHPPNGSQPFVGFRCAK